VTERRSTEQPSLLIVDDDEVLRERLARAFRERGFDAVTAASCEEAVAIASRESPEMAVIDLRMPGGSGLELLRQLKEIDAATRVVVLSGYGSIATAVEAIRLGAMNFLPKPANADAILRAFEVPDAPGNLPEDFEVPTLARAEWEHIHRVIADCGGNISEAARRLGVHRRSLQRKLQKYPPSR
jgi:two-component system, response regulator RegA